MTHRRYRFSDLLIQNSASSSIYPSKNDTNSTAYIKARLLDQMTAEPTAVVYKALRSILVSNNKYTLKPEQKLSSHGTFAMVAPRVEQHPLIATCQFDRDTDMPKVLIDVLDDLVNFEYKLFCMCATKSLMTKRGSFPYF